MADNGNRNTIKFNLRGMGMKLQNFIKAAEDAASVAGVDFLVFVRGLAHFVDNAAPIAAAIGTTTGNPAVTAGAVVAESVAKVVDQVPVQ